MESHQQLILRRRLTKTNNAKRCCICDSLDFKQAVILTINATVCNVCGHVDFFMEPADANTHPSN